MGGALARLERALHVAVPLRRRLGPRPVQPSDWRAQGLAIRGQHTRRQESRVAAARVFLLCPGELDVLLRNTRPLAKVAREAIQNFSAALLDAPPAPAPAFLALDEAEQDARRAGWRRVVEGDAHRAGIAGHLAGQPLCAPE